MASDLADKLTAFQQISHLRLTGILDSIGGSKDLVIESVLFKPLERFIGIKALKSHGVENFFKLDKKELSNGSKNVVFFVRGDLITIKRVCDVINSTSAGQLFHIIAFPTVFHSVYILIEEEGLHGKVTLHAFQWELLSLDTRLFSFECPEVFKNYFVANDKTYSVPCARSLWALQHVFGKPFFQIFIGSHAKNVHSLMAELDEGLGKPDSVGSDIGLLLVVDRSVDYASALLTPGTYTSLVADTIGINTGVVQVPKTDDKPGPPTTMILSSEEKTYNEIRHKHFSDVLSYLKQKINAFYSEQGKRHKMSVTEMRNFVKNDLKNVTNTGLVLSNHLHICEKVTNKIGKVFEGLQSCQHNILTGESRREVITFIEELIATGEDLDLVLRLMCLLSICQNGLSQNEANSLKMQFLHAYGHEHILTFYNLEKMGFLDWNATASDTTKLANKMVQAVSMPRKSSFFTTANKLRLFPDAGEDYSLKNPQDLGYVFGGIYIPLIAQIVSCIIKKDRCLKELLKCLPGELQDAVVEGKSIESSPDVAPHCVWLYVLGGITYAEIAALDLLEKKTGCRIVCSGSAIINGNTLVQSAMSC